MIFVRRVKVWAEVVLLFLTLHEIYEKIKHHPDAPCPVKAAESSSGRRSPNSPDQMHTVTKGDNIIRIAGRYGDEACWIVVMHANPNMVGPNYTIVPGKQLLIPRSVTNCSETDKEEGRRLLVDHKRTRPVFEKPDAPKTNAQLVDVKPTNNPPTQVNEPSANVSPEIEKTESQGHKEVAGSSLQRKFKLSKLKSVGKLPSLIGHGVKKIFVQGENDGR